MQWQIKKIIEVANQLKRTGRTGASTGEQIAAAFVLNRMDYLPDMYSDTVEAWDRLDSEWQEYVRIIKYDYIHLIEGELPQRVEAGDRRCAVGNRRCPP